MKKNIFLVVLVLLVIGLGGYIVYGKVVDKDKESTDSKVEVKENTTTTKEETVKKYTYKEIAGNYYFETDAKIADMPGAMARFYLVLDERGTFNYRYTNGNSPMGILGNYIIENNKITLNYIFETNGGAGIAYKEGSKIIDINNNELIDNDSLVESISGTKIEWKKSTTSNENFVSFTEVVKSNINNN